MLGLDWRNLPPVHFLLWGRQRLFLAWIRLRRLKTFGTSLRILRACRTATRPTAIGDDDFGLFTLKQIRKTQVTASKIGSMRYCLTNFMRIMRLAPRRS